jgi:hypothetical protein
VLKPENRRFQAKMIALDVNRGPIKKKKKDEEQKGEVIPIALHQLVLTKQSLTAR